MHGRDRDAQSSKLSSMVDKVLLCRRCSPQYLDWLHPHSGKMRILYIETRKWTAE